MNMIYSIVLHMLLWPSELEAVPACCAVEYVTGPVGGKCTGRVLLEYDHDSVLHQILLLT